MIDTSTGEILFDRGSGSAARPASIMKLFTAAAALETLGRLSSYDQGLSRHPGAGKIYSLERATRHFLGQESIKIRSIKKLQTFRSCCSDSQGFGQEPITQIVLDTSLYGGAQVITKAFGTLAASPTATCLRFLLFRWTVTEIALSLRESQRSMDPVTRAGTWFQEALGLAATDAVITKGLAPADSVQIAAVKSRPISEWIDYMLIVSDNHLGGSTCKISFS